MGPPPRSTTRCPALGRRLRPAEGAGEAEHADDPTGQGDEPDERRHRARNGRAGPHRQHLRDGGQRQPVALVAAGADEMIDAGIGRRHAGAAPGKGGGALGAQIPLRQIPLRPCRAGGPADALGRASIRNSCCRRGRAGAGRGRAGRDLARGGAVALGQRRVGPRGLDSGRRRCRGRGPPRPAAAGRSAAGRDGSGPSRTRGRGRGPPAAPARPRHRARGCGPAGPRRSAGPGRSGRGRGRRAARATPRRSRRHPRGRGSRRDRRARLRRRGHPGPPRRRPRSGIRIRGAGGAPGRRVRRGPFRTAGPGPPVAVSPGSRPACRRRRAEPRRPTGGPSGRPPQSRGSGSAARPLRGPAVGHGAGQADRVEEAREGGARLGVAEQQPALRPQPAAEAAHHRRDRPGIEVDQHVAAEDQVERLALGGPGCDEGQQVAALEPDQPAEFRPQGVAALAPDARGGAAGG